MKLLHCLVLMLSGALAFAQQPLDDICARTTMQERKPLAYAPIIERDIMWEKRVWRVVDLRQKMNQHFSAPQSNFCDLLIDGLKTGKIGAFSAEDEKFTYSLSNSELMEIIERTDTVEVINLETQMTNLEIVSESLNVEDIKKIRIKEIWYFDSRHSTMRVRILGIAPLLDVLDDFGNVLFEKPLFWVHYPSIRDYLSQQPVILAGNARPTISWEDQLERRYFASAIYKVSNILDERISDSYSGLNALEEAFKHEQTIFNYEHDLWSY